MPTREIPIFYPDNMTSLPNWVLWKLQPDATGRMTKVPYGVYHGKASSTNSRTWSSFAQVTDVYRSSGLYAGVGFVFTLDAGIVFIDIDHCVDENGLLNETAVDILETLHRDTYVELSQSGTGLHIFARGAIPKAFKHNSVEMYSEKRFVAMTGRAIIRKDVKALPEELLTVYEKYRTPERPKRNVSHPANVVLSLSDNDIITRASQSSKDFSRLYSGDYSGYDSHSNADLRLCLILAFWCDRDRATIDRLFRSSGLCREKWTEREDYRERTITKACDGLEESISEYMSRKDGERRKSFEDYFLHKQ